MQDYLTKGPDWRENGRALALLPSTEANKQNNQNVPALTIGFLSFILKKIMDTHPPGYMSCVVLLIQLQDDCGWHDCKLFYISPS